MAARSSLRDRRRAPISRCSNSVALRRDHRPPDRGRPRVPPLWPGDGIALHRDVAPARRSERVQRRHSRTVGGHTREPDRVVLVPRCGFRGSARERGRHQHQPGRFAHHVPRLAPAPGTRAPGAFRAPGRARGVGGDLAAEESSVLPLGSRPDGPFWRFRGSLVPLSVRGGGP